MSTPTRNFLLIVAVLTFAACAAAQNITFSFTGSGVDVINTNTSTGTGTGTLTPGGAASLSLTSRDSGNDNCNQGFQIEFTVNAANGDSLSFLFNATSFSQAGTTNTIDGTIVVTAGKGAYANMGGTGTMHTVATDQDQHHFTFTATGSVTLGGALVAKANIFPSGVADVFSDTARVAPGAWASVFGANLANGTTIWNGDFPTTLGNVTATVDGKPVYFWFVSPAQINFQVPDGTKTGCVAFVLNTPNGTVNTQVEVQPASPSFSLLDDKYVAAVILTPNGSGAYGNGSYDIAGPVGRFPYKTRPARRGENVVLYGVGFGPTNPAVPAGKPFNGAARATLNIGGAIILPNNNFVGLPISFAGLVGAGLYQINITIPQNAPLGDASLGFGINPNGPYTQGFPIYLPIGQ
jgi:uncharacterized protein (TIGR03437 family)